MKITEVEIRACSPSLSRGEQIDAIDGASLRGRSAPEIVVPPLNADEGMTGLSFGPYDIARWDIVDILPGLPIRDLIGTASDRRHLYASSTFPSPAPR